MNHNYPQPSTPESEEGDAAHWVLAQAFAGIMPALNSFAPNGQLVTEEMIEGAHLVVDEVRATVPADAMMFIEQPIACFDIHQHCWGTPDIWAFHQASMTLYLDDYKFGHGFVDEFENWQLLTYLSGILDSLSAMLKIPVAQLDQMLKVQFRIFQPRCYYKGSPIRTWTITASDGRPYFNQLRLAAELALGAEPEAIVGDYCEHCPGRHVCQALQKGAYAGARHASKSTPLELSPEAAAIELRILERAFANIKARKEGLIESLTVKAKAGQLVPGYGLEQSQGRLEWKHPPADVIAMGKLFGVDLEKPSCITPTQAEKTIDPRIIGNLAERKTGSIKLVAINDSQLRRTFSKS